jgi:hypothetical protein
VSQPDLYGDWDAAYVLGSLTVQQRHEYEDHLASCDDCRQAVSELAAMPGLLSQLPATEAIALSDHPTSDGEMPDSIRKLTPPRRFGARARLLMIAAIVLAVVLGGIGGYFVRGLPAFQSPAPEMSPVRVAFKPVHPTSMLAVADLVPSGSGTTIKVDCVYADHGGNEWTTHYALQTVDSQGNLQRGQTWAAGPGDRVMTKDWSSLPLNKIKALQIVFVDSGTVAMYAPVNR